MHERVNDVWTQGQEGVSDLHCGRGGVVSCFKVKVPCLHRYNALNLNASDRSACYDIKQLVSAVSGECPLLQREPNCRFE